MEANDSKRKAIAALIVAGKPMGKSNEKEEEGENDKEMLAGELIDALKSGDKKAVAEAFTAMLECCQGDDSSEEESE